MDPTEDRRVVHLDTAVDEHELEIAVTDREHQIPTNGPQNHFRCELTPLEATAAPIHCPATPHPDRDPIYPEYGDPRNLQQNPSVARMSQSLTASSSLQRAAQVASRA
jgi:hypothetical protein